MKLTTDFERYIFNSIAHYEPVLRRYEADAMQEICIAVLLADSEKDALRMASRNCRKMLRQFGNRSRGVVQRYEAHVLWQYMETARNLMF